MLMVVAELNLALQIYVDVSSEDDLSDNEDFISRGKLAILPPNVESDRDTEENSGDENAQFKQKSTFSWC